MLHRIPIHERVELPDELIPADSRVEIDAKITAGKMVPWSIAAMLSDQKGAHDAKVISPPENASRQTSWRQSKAGFGKSKY